MNPVALRVRRARLSVIGPRATALVGAALVIVGILGLTSRDTSSKSSPAPASPTPALTVPAGFTAVTRDGALYAGGNYARPLGPAISPGTPVIGAATAAAGGVWMARGDGSVVAEGAVPTLESAQLSPRAAPVVGIAAAARGTGYRLVTADGHVFSIGAVSRGQDTAHRHAAPVVGIASGVGDGYWIAHSDGTVTAFGERSFRTTPLPLGTYVAGIASAPSGRGFWLVDSDGAVRAVGVPSYGDLRGRLGPTRVAAITAAPGRGYWITTTDGAVHGFGVPGVAAPSNPPSAGIAAVVES